MNAFKRQVRAILASFLPEEEVEGLMLVSELCLVVYLAKMHENVKVCSGQ
jgi:hypothetical protein